MPNRISDPDASAYGTWQVNGEVNSADGQSSAQEAKVPALVIEPISGWQVINWTELVQYRDLFYFLVRREVVSKYKQTVLGLSWALVKPFVQMVLFTIIFGGVAKISSDGVPHAVFYFTGLVPWTYFSGAMSNATSSLVANKNIITKVYFPRLIIPMSTTLSKLLDFAIGMAFLPVIMAYYGVMPTWDALALPLLILIMMLSSAGIGMWLAGLSIQYRDINHATSFLVQMMMYAAPVIWPVSELANYFAGSGWSTTVLYTYSLYPMVGVLEGFRAALLGTRPMPWDMIAIGGCVAIFLFVTGALYFKRLERRFADVA